jgi:hypothetical protein
MLFKMDENDETKELHIRINVDEEDWEQDL